MFILVKLLQLVHTVAPSEPMHTIDEPHAVEVPRAIEVLHAVEVPHTVEVLHFMDVLHTMGVPHAVEVLEDSVTIDVFSPIRQDWLDATDEDARRSRHQMAAAAP